MKLKPIGVIKSPYRSREEAPKQGLDSDVTATLVFYHKKQVEKVKDCKRLRMLYWTHLADRATLWSEKKKRGVFATRSPDRPNPIAIAVVEVLEAKEKEITVRHLDALDGTPILTVSPFY